MDEKMKRIRLTVVLAALLVIVLVAGLVVNKASNQADRSVAGADIIGGADSASAVLLTAAGPGGEKHIFPDPDEDGNATRYMTLDDVRIIAKNLGQGLTLGDLSGFIGEDIGSGFYIIEYEVENGTYRLIISPNNNLPETEIYSASLGKAGEEGTKLVNLYYYDVEKYLRDGTRELIRPLPEAVPSPSSAPKETD